MRRGISCQSDDFPVELPGTHAEFLSQSIYFQFSLVHEEVYEVHRFHKESTLRFSKLLFFARLLVSVGTLSKFTAQTAMAIK